MVLSGMQLPEHFGTIILTFIRLNQNTIYHEKVFYHNCFNCGFCDVCIM